MSNMSNMGSQGTGRKRSSNKDRSTAEDDALNLIAKEAEARLAAKRAARAEAREIRMRELERQQKEIFQVQKKYYGLNTKVDDRVDDKWGDIEQWMEDSERYSRPSQVHTLSDDDERLSVGSRGSVRSDLDSVYGAGGSSLVPHKKSKKKKKHKHKDKDRNGYDDEYGVVSSRSSRLSDDSRVSRSSRGDLLASYASSNLYSLNGLSSTRNTGSTGAYQSLEYSSFHRSNSRTSSRANSARASPVDNCGSVASYLRSAASSGGLPRDLDDVTIPDFSDVDDKDYLEKGSRAASALTATTLTSLGGSSSRRGSVDTAITVDAETAVREIKEIHELKDQIQDVESKYTQNLKEAKDALTEVEEKYRKAMVSNAQLDNEKNNLMYQVDTLKDSLMELEELLSESRREYEEKVKEFDREKHAHGVLQFQLAAMKETLKQSEELLNEIRQLRMKQDGFTREISDLQETVEWKDKKIGALERQKEYTDAIRIERDELREEVVKLKDILKKHGIVLGPDMSINGSAGETETEVSTSGDSAPQPAQDSSTFPAEGNSMLGSSVETQLRSSGKEEVDQEQHQDVFEEAQTSHFSSDRLSNTVHASLVESCSTQQSTEEQKMPLKDVNGGKSLEWQAEADELAVTKDCDELVLSSEFEENTDNGNEPQVNSDLEDRVATTKDIEDNSTTIFEEKPNKHKTIDESLSTKTHSYLQDVNHSESCSEEGHVRDLESCPPEDVINSEPCPQENVNNSVSCTQDIKDYESCPQENVNNSVSCTQDIKDYDSCPQEDVKDSESCPQENAKDSELCTREDVKDSASCTQEKYIKDSELCPQVENLKDSESESVPGVSNTELQCETENAEANNDDVEEIQIKAPLGGANAPLKKKKKKRRGKKKGGSLEERNQPKDNKEAARTYQESIQPEAVSKDDGSGTECSSEGRSFKHIKESSTDQVTKDIDQQHTAEQVEHIEASYFEQPNKSKMDQVSGEWNNEQHWKVEKEPGMDQVVKETDWQNADQADFAQLEHNETSNIQNPKESMMDLMLNADERNNEQNLEADKVKIEENISLTLQLSQTQSHHSADKQCLKQTWESVKVEVPEFSGADVLVDFVSSNTSTSLDGVDVLDDMATIDIVKTAPLEPDDHSESKNHLSVTMDSTAQCPEAPSKPSSATDSNSDMLIGLSDKGVLEKTSTSQKDEQPEAERVERSFSSENPNDGSVEKPKLSESKKENELLDLVKSENSSNDLDKVGTLVETQAEHFMERQTLLYEDQMDAAASDMEVQTQSSPEDAGHYISPLIVQRLSNEQLSSAGNLEEHKNGQSDRKSLTVQPLQESTAETNNISQPYEQDNEEQIEEDEEGQSFDFDDINTDVAVEIQTIEHSQQEEVEVGVDVLSDDNSDVLVQSSTNIEIVQENSQGKPMDGEVCADVATADKNLDVVALVQVEASSEKSVEEQEEKMQPQKMDAMDEQSFVAKDRQPSKAGEFGVLENTSEDQFHPQAASLPVEEALNVVEQLHEDLSATQVGGNRVTPPSGKDEKRNSKKGKSKGKDDCKMT
ncbi:uncharacterized protein lrrfip1a isoform X6 [Dunckerocampus dactyliophorus]|uniref:uncharacterized protein lrrfip1a isoform X6 n=1 Tax=Dunckerocampus dactyliophorus TaxID=161453 RepID=UPI00240756CE|nr:uncharacterized protein lrrfip1a isoform X6 [Dunckerocampus dactyliophorus]